MGRVSAPNWADGSTSWPPSRPADRGSTRRRITPRLSDDPRPGARRAGDPRVAASRWPRRPGAPDVGAPRADRDPSRPPRAGGGLRQHPRLRARGVLLEPTLMRRRAPRVQIAQARRTDTGAEFDDGLIRSSTCRRRARRQRAPVPSPRTVESRQARIVGPPCRIVDVLRDLGDLDAEVPGADIRGGLQQHPPRPNGAGCWRRPPPARGGREGSRSARGAPTSGAPGRRRPARRRDRGGIASAASTGRGRRERGVIRRRVDPPISRPTRRPRRRAGRPSWRGETRHTDHQCHQVAPA